MTTTATWCALGCDHGWLYGDDENHPQPCPSCRDHLTVCRRCHARYVTSTSRVKGTGHDCPEDRR